MSLEDGSRVECLDHLESADGDDTSEWNNTWLKRFLVDYMLRMSHYDTVTKLAESSNLQVFGKRVYGIVFMFRRFCFEVDQCWDHRRFCFEVDLYFKSLRLCWHHVS
ncbi:putative protein Fyv10/Macrophage erythroblast attacher [Helianthus anomalus]